MGRTFTGLTIKEKIMAEYIERVEEVKHGEWIYDSNTDEPRCSECKEDEQ